MTVIDRDIAEGQVRNDTRFPTASTAETQDGGDGHLNRDTHWQDAITSIREHQSHRIATIKMQMRIQNQCRALVRRALGWNPQHKDREKLNKLAESIVMAIQKGKPIDDEYKVVADAVRSFCIAAKQSLKPFIEYREHLETKMVDLVKSLPVSPFVETIHGFGYLGLSIIVGEAGDLGSYGNPGKLWKRMGLAVFDGKSQRKCLDAVKAAEQGYNPRRRSAMWTIGDSLLKKENPYRKLYLARKAFERERAPEMSKMQSHRRAQRYAEKRLLKHIWQAWRRQAITD